MRVEHSPASLRESVNEGARRDPKVERKIFLPSGGSAINIVSDVYFRGTCIMRASIFFLRSSLEELL